MAECTYPGCTRNLWYAGLCSAHYQRKRKGQDMDAPFRNHRTKAEVATRDPDGRKQCPVCSLWLPLDAFYSRGDAVDYRCRSCVSISQYKAKYGLTPQDIADLLESQGGCAICHRDSPPYDQNWHVDHDHSCCAGVYTCGNCIRGILCGPCNNALGYFEDSAERLESAKNYLAGGFVKIGA